MRRSASGVGLPRAMAQFLALVLLVVGNGVGSAQAACDDVPVEGGGDLTGAIEAAYARWTEKAEFGPQRRDFLACVAKQSLSGLDSIANGSGETKPTIARLRFLGQRIAWESSDEDALDALKSASRALKVDKITPDKVALVAALDLAILQHKGELADILRPKTVYSEFVAAKATTIEAIREEGTYADGPYELFVDEVEAFTLEEKFFLDADSGDVVDLDILKRAIGIYDAMLEKLAEPDSAATDHQRQTSINEMRFRAAIDAILVNDRAKAIDYLQAISASSETWATNKNLDHIYVRRFLRLPFDIRVFETGTETFRAEYDKSLEIKQFYNPRQLALYLCGLLEEWTPPDQPYYLLDEQLLQFNNFDYRIYLASSAKQKDLENVLDKMQTTLKQAGNTNNTTALLALAERANDSELREIVRAGVETCLPDGELPDIAPVSLDVRGNWMDGENPNRSVFGIYFGGNLTFDEANEAADLLQSILDRKDAPYLARPTIDG